MGEPTTTIYNRSDSVGGEIERSRLVSLHAKRIGHPPVNSQNIIGHCRVLPAASIAVVFGSLPIALSHDVGFRQKQVAPKLLHLECPHRILIFVGGSKVIILKE